MESSVLLTPVRVASITRPTAGSSISKMMSGMAMVMTRSPDAPGTRPETAATSTALVSATQ